MPTIAFGSTTAGDAESLADLRVVAMRESLEHIGRFDPVRARQRFLTTFDPALTRHIVADGVRIGFVVVRPIGGGLLLDHLYIDPRFQRRGYGAAVLKQVFADADLQRVDIRVGALKESDANRFYVSHGFVFVEASEFDNYYVRKYRP
jgi:ribosomal protein S18 acetylase RimI-like enzyme